MGQCHINITVYTVYVLSACLAVLIIQSENRHFAILICSGSLLSALQVP